MKALVPILTAGLLLAADAPKEDVKADKEKIRGTWKVVSAEDGGKKLPDPENHKVIIGKDTLTIKAGDRTLVEATYELDPAHKPKGIDLTDGDKKMPGIYELNDDDLKICINERPGGERPTEFASKAGSPNDLLIVLKREKP